MAPDWGRGDTSLAPPTRSLVVLGSLLLGLTLLLAVVGPSTPEALLTSVARPSHGLQPQGTVDTYAPAGATFADPRWPTPSRRATQPEQRSSGSSSDPLPQMRQPSPLSWLATATVTALPVVTIGVFFLARGWLRSTTADTPQPRSLLSSTVQRGPPPPSPASPSPSSPSLPGTPALSSPAPAFPPPPGEPTWERVLTSYAHGTLRPAAAPTPGGGPVTIDLTSAVSPSPAWRPPLAMMMVEEALSPALTHLLPGQVISVMRALRLRGASLGLDAHARAAVTVYRLGRMQADVHTLVATALEGVLQPDSAMPKPAKSDVVGAFGDTVLQYVEDLQRMGAAEALMQCVADSATQSLTEDQYQLLLLLLTENSTTATSSVIFLAKRLDQLQGVAQRVRSVERWAASPDSGSLVRPAEVLRPAEKHAAQLALHVWAHLANALGLMQFKADLEEIGFQLLHPAEHAEMHTAMDTSGRRYERVLQEATDALKAALLGDPALQAEMRGLRVTGRTKTPYSVWRKMQKKDLKFHEVLDKVALRVVLDVDAAYDAGAAPGECGGRAEEVCYHVRDKIRALFATIPEKNKDYIRKPKANGYQSLHMIAVKYTAEGHAVPIEIQIRSRAMDQQAEYGVAGHWQYKMVDGKGNAKQTLRAACQNLFAEIDQDGSGVIDQEELGLLLRRLGAPVPPEEVGTALAIFDTDGNGVIDFEEFWTALHTTWFAVLSGDLKRGRVLA